MYYIKENGVLFQIYKVEGDTTILFEFENPENIIEKPSCDIKTEDLIASCDGCGVIDPSVQSDGFGFNCCYNPCDEYIVRGLSRSDFF